MTDIIHTISPPLERAPAPANDTVTADGWWPDVSIREFRDRHRVTEDITDSACRDALCSGMQSSLNDLDGWAAALTFEFASLDDVPAPKIDGISRFVLCWRRAVMAFAKADLIETRRDYDATGAGERNDDFVDVTIVQLRRDAIHAIRDLKQKPRTAARLI